MNEVILKIQNLSHSYDDDQLSLKKIKSSVVDWYDDLEKNRYVAFAFDSPNFETYYFVDVWTKYNDDKYLIELTFPYTCTVTVCTK